MRTSVSHLAFRTLDRTYLVNPFPDMPHDTEYPSVSDTDFGGFLSDTAVLRFDTDCNKIYGEQIFNHIMPCMCHKTILYNGLIVYC